MRLSEHMRLREGYGTMIVTSPGPLNISDKLSKDKILQNDNVICEGC